MAKGKANAGMLFERHEKKFMVPPEQFKSLLEELAPYMQADEYGLHTISTVYWDSEDFHLIRHSLDRPNFKEKLRLRSYGTPGETDTVYLELKKKLAGVTYKRRMPLPLRQAREYLEHGVTPPESRLCPQTFGEIDWFLHRIPLAPKAVLSYERIALYGREDGAFRMTFDGGIRWRDHNLDLGRGDYGALLLRPGVRLLEVKTLDALPLWLCRLLSRRGIYPTSFSKYGAVYTEHLRNTQKEATPIAG